MRPITSFSILCFCFRIAMLSVFAFCLTTLEGEMSMSDEKKNKFCYTFEIHRIDIKDFYKVYILHLERTISLFLQTVGRLSMILSKRFIQNRMIYQNVLN